MKIFAAIFAFSLAAAGPALAQDEPERLALVIGNGAYKNAPTAETAVRDAKSVADALKDAGWEVTLQTDLDREGMHEVLGRFAEAADDADDVVIFFSGHALRTGGDIYLAPVDQEADSLVDVLFGAVPFSLVLRMAEGASGQGVVFVDGAQLAGFEPTSFVEPGLAEITAPEGVLVVSAAPPGQAIRRSPDRDSRFAQLIVDKLLQPGAELAATVDEAGGPTWVTGKAEAGFILNPAPEPLTEEGGLEHEIELAYWRAAERSGRAEDYRAYLERYPDGVFADFARDRLDLSKSEPLPEKPTIDPALAAELDLDLGRDRVRQIQQWLRAVGYEPGSVDGLFGPNTRTAYQRWERAQGLDANGYVDRAELDRLSTQGEAALAQAAEREEHERQVAAAEDNGYWAATGAKSTAAGYRAYLDRYPEGLHAEAARAALQAMDEAEADQALREERRAFRQARRADTPEAYRDYLADYPQGVFREDALARLDEIEGAERDQAEQERLERVEDALGLNRADRLSVEQRLRSLGFEPGPLDGQFDARARAAIGDYQASRGTQTTGYLDRPTVVGIVQETSDTRLGSGDGADVIRNLLQAFGAAIGQQ